MTELTGEALPRRYSSSYTKNVMNLLHGSHKYHNTSLPDLSDHGVISGGDLVEDAIDAGQLLLILDGDAVIGLVIVLQGATEVPEDWECLLVSEIIKM